MATPDNPPERDRLPARQKLDLADETIRARLEFITQVVGEENTWPSLDDAKDSHSTGRSIYVLCDE